MIARALVVALSCACAVALAPLTAPTDDDCALYLTGPGRSSAYDYSLNLLKGNFGYEGQHTCITYEAINQAYLDARNRILVSQPKGDWKAEDFASVGELMLDISINLARTYGLTYEEIEKGLPLIDTSRTLIREVCPPVFSHVECRAGKYRRFDGLCNNLRHPTWGATMAPFQRLIGPLFADGINAPRIAHTGHDLPLSRVVSRTMHPDEGFHDHAGTVMVIAWGQFMDHDYTLTGTPLDPINRNDPEECCKRPPHLKHPYCNEIRVPDDDYFYRLWGVKCIDFVRGFPSPRPGCRLGSRIPFNTLTGSIDGNTVYGVTEKFARKLRTGYGGLLRMNPVFKEYGLKDLLPLKLDIPDEGCTRPNKNMYCFEAGEIRVNEQLVLTVMHTLMAREHNRVAEGLAAVNPHWDDETLFQEARRINIAEIQHITYNEFLPILLGKDVMEKFGLVLEKEGYWNGYDPKVNPDVLASFAAAAYRFGHSLLPTAVERWSKAHKFIASKRLSDLIRRPYDLYRAGVLDEYVMGLMNQVAQAMDDSITQEVTNHLFKKIGARFGMDLVSFNMQRGREFGLPGYMEFRKFCGLSGADTFQDLFGSMANETVRKYETIFEHPVDVDLWSGGVSERPLPGSMLGPTFACIIATQFSYSRRGDRFWFELPNQPSSFTPEQLAEIRKSRLARVICDNTDIIDTVQLYPMVLPDHELNPRVPCRSGIIPSMDFSKWAEPAPFHGTAKQFMTDAIATNNTFVCNEDLTENNDTKEIEPQTRLQNDTNENISCDVINTTPLGEIVGENITAKVDVNIILQSNNDNIETEKCLNANITTETCKTAQSKTELNKNSDTVTKFVYNMSDKTITQNKSKGHSKNSILRKKRSLEVEPSYDVKSLSPASVDYTTSHNIKDREELLSPQYKPESIIKKDNLANFHIETLHADSGLPANNGKKENYNQNKPKSTKLFNYDHTSSEPRKYDKVERLDKNERESTESDSRDSSETNEDIDGRNHHSPYVKQKENIYKSNENSDELPHPKENTDNDGIKTYSKYIPKDDDRRVNYKSHSDSQYTRNPTIQDDVENSSESNEYGKSKSDKINASYEDKPASTDTPRSLQDVDLGDFSYERIQVNDRGQVEPTKDLNENYDSDVIIPNTAPVSTIEKTKPEPLTVEVESTREADINVSHEQPININDGEVKPVVELNSEDYSGGISEEKSNELLNSNLEKSEESNKSSEEEQANSKELNEKIVVLPENDGGKVNVKQQFERIPLDYNHDNKSQAQEENENTDKSETAKLNQDDKTNDGTLDSLLPKEETYDDNLNIKFDEIPIKLPEIDFSDDILSYAGLVAPKKKKNKSKKKSKKTYHYNDDDDSEENQDEVKKGIYNDHDHYGIYNSHIDKDHANYRISGSPENEDDDGVVDLYEKFVRERFGKRGSFGKRSEKLQAERKPKNPKLLKTIQTLLKQTEKVRDDAAKSGDPNAGYMWTLEYGENH